MTPVGRAINNIDVPRSATRGCRRDASAHRSSDSIRFCPAIARTCAKWESHIVSKIEKNRADPCDSRSSALRRLREIVTTLSPWNGGALIRHSKDNSLRGWPKSAEKTVSAEKLEAGGIRSSPRRPKAAVFLVGTVRLAKSGTGIISREKFKKMLTRFRHIR
jgi:hypothetical protein